MGDVVSRPIPLPTASGAFGPNPGTTGFVDITGIVAVETSGFPVTVVVRQGAAGGTVLAAAVCTANGTSSTSFYTPVRSNGQLYAVVSGTGVLAGSVSLL